MQVVAVDGDPAAFGEARLRHDDRHPVDRDPDEQVVGDPLAALEHGLLARHVELDDLVLRHVLDPARRELVEEALRDLRRDGNRPRHRRDDSDLGLLPDSPLDELVVEEERALERRRRALVGLAEDPDQDGAAGEGGQGVAHPLGPGDRVVLAARPRRSPAPPPCRTRRRARPRGCRRRTSLRRS